MDNALILEGPQGVGKSSALRALMPDPEWFGDALPDFHTKDASEYLNGKWVVELAELTSVLRSELEDMRRFMTQRVDEYRPAYGRKKIYRPRRCILSGSTNRDDYLRDAQGERRLWPVVCGKNIDVLGIERDRDILWKEAYDAFNRGEGWYLDPILSSHATREQKERVEVDPLLEKVAEIVGDMDEVAPRYVFDILGIPPTQWGKMKRSMSSMLVLLGYERDKERKYFKAGQYRDHVRYIKVGVSLKK
jgi:predicted P-loop ATPase